MTGGFKINPGNNRNMKDLVLTVNEVSKENSSLIICPASFDLAYSYHAFPELFYGKRKLSKALAEKQVYAVNSFSEIPESVIRYSKQIIFLDADAAFTLPKNGILKGLEKSHLRRSVNEVPGIFKVYEFSSMN